MVVSNRAAGVFGVEELFESWGNAAHLVDDLVRPGRKAHDDTVKGRREAGNVNPVSSCIVPTRNLKFRTPEPLRRGSSLDPIGSGD